MIVTPQAENESDTIAPESVQVASKSVDEGDAVAPPTSTEEAKSPEMSPPSPSWPARLCVRLTKDNAIARLILGTFYYLLKPKEIKGWWWRGRIFIMLFAVATGVAVYSLLTLAATFIVFTSVSTGSYRNASESNSYYTTGTTFIKAVIAVAICLFF
ncbi:hypothetical protein FI667_g15472, partial [Globisporangium splendens]